MMLEIVILIFNKKFDYFILSVSFVFISIRNKLTTSYSGMTVPCAGALVTYILIYGCLLNYIANHTFNIIIFLFFDLVTWSMCFSFLSEWKGTLSSTKFDFMVWTFPPTVLLCRRERWNGSHPLRKCICVMECWRVILPWFCCLKKVSITDVTSGLLTSKLSSSQRQYLVGNVRIESVT